VLVEKFDIKPIGEVGADIEAMMAGEGVIMGKCSGRM